MNHFVLYFGVFHNFQSREKFRNLYFFEQKKDDAIFIRNQMKKKVIFYKSHQIGFSLNIYNFVFF